MPYYLVPCETQIQLYLLDQLFRSKYIFVLNIFFFCVLCIVTFFVILRVNNNNNIEQLSLLNTFNVNHKVTIVISLGNCLFMVYITVWGTKLNFLSPPFLGTIDFCNETAIKLCFECHFTKIENPRNKLKNSTKY